MDTKTGHEPKRKIRQQDLNEWEIVEGNNRIYRIKDQYEKYLQLLLEGEPAENVGLYNDFLKRVRFEGIGTVRQMNYILTLRKLKMVTKGVSLAELDKKHVEAFLDYIGRFSAGTINIRFRCLAKFLKFIGKVELVDGVKPPREGKTKVKASDLLSRDDIRKLLEACNTARGRAFVMTLYESGARIGELLNLRLSDLQFDPDGVLVEIDGKTGRRRIRLVESARYLDEWVKAIKESHPNTPYLWFGEKEDEPSQYAATAKFLKKTARIAGLRKRVNPHMFRHSRASELAQKLREPQLRAFMGWSGGSTVPQIYVHLSAQDMDKAILGLYKTEDRKPETDELMKFFQIWKSMRTLG